MRLDEMIIKANADGKTYFCNGTDFEYSKEKGFVEYVDFLPNGISDLKRIATVFINGWEEKPKRHMTVSEAEKELDCVIDTPDISKLFRPGNVPPSDYRTVFIIRKNLLSSRGYYSGDWNSYQGSGWAPSNDVAFWIDPADLIKLLPKE